MHNIILSASLMCADPFYLKETLDLLDHYSVDFIHYDIMDGHFVNNIGISIDYINKIRQYTKIKSDFHIMAFSPEKIIRLLNPRPGDLISVHASSTNNIFASIDESYSRQCRFLLAINQHTDIKTLDSIIKVIDGINLLLVKPGFCGQTVLENSLDYAQEIGHYIQEYHPQPLYFEVDGGITRDRLKILSSCGANAFVLGTSSIFKNNRIDRKELDIINNIKYEYKK